MEGGLAFFSSFKNCMNGDVAYFGFGRRQWLIPWDNPLTD